MASASVSCGVLEPDALPETAEELRALVLEQRAALRERHGVIERLQAQLTWLRRQQFGRSSEKIEREIAQLAAAGGPRRELFGTHRSPIAGSSRWPASTPAAAGSLAARGDRTRARLQLPGL